MAEGTTDGARVCDDEVCAPQELGDEVCAPQELGDEVCAPQELGDEVRAPQDQQFHQQGLRGGVSYPEHNSVKWTTSVLAHCSVISCQWSASPLYLVATLAVSFLLWLHSD